MQQSNECRFSDPAEWEVNADLIGYYAENVPSQNLKSDFLLMGRQFGDKIRYAQKEYFLRKLSNGEVVKRDWLIYSPSTAEFDPFLMERIRKYGNPGKGKVSYMSSTICDEFINILGSKVLTLKY
ncbi:hypothetical protein HELRODRAFT_164055 [Helobdella robusta]|uniref:Uncharacterized protein n=1 Tax=Helobdella robusta TaxID=6412 RepID=T1EUU5_HELRO|nr:hypothetical protein HELRODRAFT_164055 [Helobdella robusta]ESN94250.1 hypothetical protein HELRODRAFT_164055 [Helobdella robusta]